jgi:hypothetical protein
MNKTEEYLSFIEDSLKLCDGSMDETHTRLIKIWARLSEYLYYSDVTFEKFNREMGYDHFDYNNHSSSESEESTNEEEESTNEESTNEEETEDDE